MDTFHSLRMTQGDGPHTSSIGFQIGLANLSGNESPVTLMIVFAFWCVEPT